MDGLRSSDINRAVRSAEALCEAADESRVPDLYALLDDSDFFIREAAAEPLARLEGARALPVLFRALAQGAADGHDNDGLSDVIATLLEASGGEAAPLLLRMLRSLVGQEREDAAWALGFLPAEVALEPLLDALGDGSPTVRSAAAGSLGSFEGDRVVVALIERLGDEDERVRVSAADALGYVGDARTIPALRQALRDPAKGVRPFAADALKRLGA